MRVLVLSPHPDDEAIGVGGTLRRHVLDGDQVQTVFLTSGDRGCPGEDRVLTALKREGEAYAAAAVLKTLEPLFWRHIDGELERDASEVVLQLADFIAGFKPDRVYVPHDDEAHPDHKAASSLLRSALARCVLDPQVLMYEIWSPLVAFDEALTVDVSETIGAKLLAIRAHESQVSRIRFDEAALCLARYRGELHNRPHGPYAEVFREMVL